MKKILFISLAIACAFASQAQKVIRYDLYVSDTVVNFKTKSVRALAINGQIPAPALEFTEGDTAEIHVHNRMHHETSLHWHGLILPNQMDGVPYLTTAPIKGHSSAVYKFPLVQNGTYWYHSHTMLQEQLGLYGAFIIRKRNQTEKDYTVVLSDWTNENPNQVERSLHYATDWYAIRKQATQNYAEAIKEGHLSTKLENEWKRMMAMDVSDVYYDQFLSNGKHQDSQIQFKAGDTVRLRVINASSSTYFWLKYAGGKISVVANDGMDVEPVAVDRLIIGVSETYDVKVIIPEEGSYEFLATSEDRTGSTSVWLGSGERRNAEPMPRLKYFEGMKMMNGMMKMNGQMNDMGMQMSLQQMDMNAVMYSEIIENEEPIVTLNYAMLKSPVTTTLPDGPMRTIQLNLTGNMNRYVWTIDNKTVSETDKILIKRGENIRMIIYNNSMMRHPMHLHGHFFRVRNGYDEYSPLKNVLDIMPMETDTIEFHASETGGDWYFHCHILYHMMAGMGRIFTYENSPANPDIPNPQKALRKVYHDDRRLFWGAEIGMESNGSDGELMLSNTRLMVQTEWRAGLTKEAGFESESHFGRFIGRNQFFMPYVGWDVRYRPEEENERNLFGQTNTKNDRGVFCAGFQYTLPFFIRTDFRIDHTGTVRLQVSRDDIPVTARMRLRAAFNSDREYTIGARYIVTKYLSISTHYDSDMKWGGGLTISY